MSRAISPSRLRSLIRPSLQHVQFRSVDGLMKFWLDKALQAITTAVPQLASLLLLINDSLPDWGTIFAAVSHLHRLEKVTLAGRRLRHLSTWSQFTASLDHLVFVYLCSYIASGAQYKAGEEAEERAYHASLRANSDFQSLPLGFFPALRHLQLNGSCFWIGHFLLTCPLLPSIRSCTIEAVGTCRATTQTNIARNLQRVLGSSITSLVVCVPWDAGKLQLRAPPVTYEPMLIDEFMACVEGFARLREVTLSSIPARLVTNELCDRVSRAWPDIEVLKLMTDRPPLAVDRVTMATVEGLRYFAERSANLHYLSLQIDATKSASAFEDTDPDTKPATVATRMRVFDTQCSPADDPKATAKMLKALVPNLWDVW